jgi:hypothetical protein
MQNANLYIIKKQVRWLYRQYHRAKHKRPGRKRNQLTAELIARTNQIHRDLTRLTV